MAAISQLSDIRESPSSSPGPMSAGVMLYNGVSNRSRGWKSRKSGESQVASLGGADARPVPVSSVKRWDGAARVWSGWDHLRKDPELWFENGNCFVHLYEKGQSQRGPAFKVPFACLLSSQCQPLVDMSVDRSLSEEEAYQNGRVDLYIPAPSTASRSQALQHHIATRNFFAWIFRRSMVGGHLGNSLVELAQSMQMFRNSGVDNSADLLSYLADEGYFEIKNQPNHALAILHFAETLQLRRLYVDAFAHCVGMSERLHTSPEYSRISMASRKLIRSARIEMDLRLSRANTMLNDLLHEELSEAYLGLSAGARSHLDRFRAYIRGFYVTKFGHFPPPNSDPRCSTAFSPEACRLMMADFEALYMYLANENLTTADSSSFLAQGGLCTLQSVHEFNLRHRFAPLDHPLPLLPEPVKGKELSRRKSMPWYIGNGRSSEARLRADQRLVAYAALKKATNHEKVHLLENRLVLAYRQFEEDPSFATHKADRTGRVSLGQGDARKVRWLFVYAVYQTLRSCAEIPEEVDIGDNVDYHLCISTKGIPPWHSQNGDSLSPSTGGRDANRLKQTLTGRCRSVSAIPLLSPSASSREPEPKLDNGTEIKPDIDYFALNHQAEIEAQEGVAVLLPRTRSVSRDSLRRSLSIFRNSTPRPSTVRETCATPTRTKSDKRKSAYQEIIVHGYGNGTNSVIEKSADSVDVLADVKESSQSLPRLSVVTANTASRSASSSSRSSHGSAMSSFSGGAQSGASMTPTTVDGSPRSSKYGSSNTWGNIATTFASDGVAGKECIATKDVEHGDVTYPLTRQPTCKPIRTIYSSDDMLVGTSKAEPPPLPRRSSKRSGIKRFRSTQSKRWSLIDVVASLREGDREDDSDSDGGFQPSPQGITSNKLDASKIKNMTAGEPCHDDDAFLDSSGLWEKTVHGSRDVSPPCAWEQYLDLGGLQPIHAVK